MTPWPLRPMSLDDVTETYVGWLNDPETTRWLGTKCATLQSQTMWVVDRLGHPDVRLYAIVDREDRRGRMVGSLKLERHGDTVTLALMIGDPASRGRGVGSKAIRRGTDLALQEWPGIGRIEAGIMVGNWPSLRAFLKAGYDIASSPRSSPGVFTAWKTP